MSWFEIGIQIGGQNDRGYDRDDRGYDHYPRNDRQDPNRALDCEARRVAYMLNTGDPYAEHEAAMQLSQDLYDMPVWAQRNLIEKTQMYQNPDMGAQLVVEPVLQRTYDGRLYDTGNRDVRVIDRQFGLDDEVAYLHSNNTGYYRPGARIDVFAGVDRCDFRNRMPWMDNDWQRHSRDERRWWQDRNDWRDYDGRQSRAPGFVRPNVGVEFDLRINNFHQSSPAHNNVFNNVNIRNYYETRVQNNTTINNTRIYEGKGQPLPDGDRRFHPTIPPVQTGTDRGGTNGVIRQPLPDGDHRVHPVTPNVDHRFQQTIPRTGNGQDNHDQQRRVIVPPDAVLTPKQQHRFERQQLTPNEVDPAALQQQREEWERKHKKQ